MPVIPLPSRIDHALPLLVCVDLQREFLAPGRPFMIDGADGVIDRMRKLLTSWRRMKLPVAHLARIEPAPWFNKASEYSEWIDELGPRPGELVFEHAKLSCYSSARFSEYLDNIMRPMLKIVGFSLDGSILATAIEAYHRDHDIVVVDDAIACAPVAGLKAEACRPLIVSLLRQFARIESIDAVLGQARRVGASIGETIQ